MKNFKLISIFASSLLVLIFLSSCISNDLQNNNTSDQTETGYSKGQVQKECLYYNDILWEYDIYSPDKQQLTQLPQDVNLIGKTLCENSYEIPCQDFYTSHINAGLNVYLDSLGEAIYIEHQEKQTIYYRYVPSDCISNNEVSTQANIDPIVSNVLEMLFNGQDFSESYGYCFIIAGAENTLSPLQTNPILVFESESTYSLFLSAFSSIAPHGAYSTPPTTLARLNNRTVTP